jgi:peptidoglycan/LPS O-acetylase OafA/YrhL
LLVLRAFVLLLAVVALGGGVIALMFGAGAEEPRIDALAARFAISLALGASVIATSFIGKEGPDVGSEAELAASLYQTTMRRVLAAAAVGPIGLLLSWLSGDGTYVIFGTGLALLLMAVAAPTGKRLKQYQSEVDDAGSDLSVMSALSRRY